MKPEERVRSLLWQFVSAMMWLQAVAVQSSGSVALYVGLCSEMPLIKNRVKGRSPGDQIAVVVRQNLARGASHYRHGGNRLG